MKNIKNYVFEYTLIKKYQVILLTLQQEYIKNIEKKIC